MSDEPKQLNYTADNFLLKTTTVYGASGSGKSTVIRDVLSLLKPIIPNITVFCPTADQNDTFDDVIPTRLIKRDVTIEAIKEVVKRQEGAAEVYKIANDRQTLESLFNKVASDAQHETVRNLLEVEQKIIDKLNDANIDQGTRDKEIGLIKAMSLKNLIKYYKKIINFRKKVLLSMKLPKNEEMAVTFLYLNPHMLLVFDDCTSAFTKKLQNDPVMKDLFYRGRWAYFTILFAFHDDVSLESYLRKNSFNSIFTTSECAVCYFGRSANGFSKDFRARSGDCITKIFESGDLPEFSKLMYIRGSNDPFRYFIAKRHVDLRFGSTKLWELCEKADEADRKKKITHKSTFGVYKK